MFHCKQTRKKNFIQLESRSLKYYIWNEANMRQNHQDYKQSDKEHWPTGALNIQKVTREVDTPGKLHTTETN